MAEESPLTLNENKDRLRVIEASYCGDEATVREGLSHESGDVRLSALVGLHRLESLTADVLQTHVNDDSSDVRRIAAQLAAHYPTVAIADLLDDTDVYVAEMAAWSLGERVDVSDSELHALITASESSDDALVREAATASLGAIGDERGLPAILRACTDKPAIRRRAVLALAPFEGPEVDAALENALTDRDWQVRQNAEDMLRPRDGEQN